jgi:transposase
MSNQRYPEEFKQEAVKQVTERGHSVSDVSKRLDISANSLYAWVSASRGSKGKKASGVEDSIRQENARLKSELKRVEEERDILKKAAAYFAKESV